MLLHNSTAAARNRPVGLWYLNHCATNHATVGVVVVAVVVVMAVAVIMVIAVVIAVRYYDWCRVSVTTGGVLSPGGREDLRHTEEDGREETDAADAVRRWRHCYTGWPCRCRAENTLVCVADLSSSDLRSTTNYTDIALQLYSWSDTQPANCWESP